MSETSEVRRVMPSVMVWKQRRVASPPGAAPISEEIVLLLVAANENGRGRAPESTSGMVIAVLRCE